MLTKLTVFEFLLRIKRLQKKTGGVSNPAGGCTSAVTLTRFGFTSRPLFLKRKGAG
jgi:hypothetical protein